MIMQSLDCLYEFLNFTIDLLTTIGLQWLESHWERKWMLAFNFSNKCLTLDHTESTVFLSALCTLRAQNTPRKAVDLWHMIMQSLLWKLHIQIQQIKRKLRKYFKRHFQYPGGLAGLLKRERVSLHFYLNENCQCEFPWSTAFPPACSGPMPQGRANGNLLTT